MQTKQHCRYGWDAAACHINPAARASWVPGRIRSDGHLCDYHPWRTRSMQLLMGSCTPEQPVLRCCSLASSVSNRTADEAGGTGRLPPQMMAALSMP